MTRISKEFILGAYVGFRCQLDALEGLLSWFGLGFFSSLETKKNLLGCSVSPKYHKTALKKMPTKHTQQCTKKNISTIESTFIPPFSLCLLSCLK